MCVYIYIYEFERGIRICKGSRAMYRPFLKDGET